MLEPELSFILDPAGIKVVRQGRQRYRTLNSIDRQSLGILHLGLGPVAGGFWRFCHSDLCAQLSAELILCAVIVPALVPKSRILRILILLLPVC